MVLLMRIMYAGVTKSRRAQALFRRGLDIYADQAFCGGGQPHRQRALSEKLPGDGLRRADSGLIDRCGCGAYSRRK